MKVFLTGATGTIGGAILTTLIAAGHEVTIAVRNLPKAEELTSKLGPNVKVHLLDSSQGLYTQFNSAAKGFTKIVHSGFWGGPQDNESETQTINGLLDAAKETSGTAQVTLILTTGGLCQGETDRLLGEDETSTANCIEFAKPRLVHEELVINANSENLHTSVIRPVVVYPESHVDHWLLTSKNLGKIVVPQGNASISYIHKEDLGELYRLVLENSGTGYFTASEGLGPNLDQIIDLAKSITGVQEVERVDNVWEHVQTFGIYPFLLTVNSILDSKRGRQLYGYQPKHNFLRDATTEIKLA